MIKEKHLWLYMNIAKLCAKQSVARRLQVGCVIVKDDNVISMSWNGMPPGWNNDCEIHTTKGLVTKNEVLHSEENAICKLAKSNGNADGATMFITHSPCFNCSRLIYKAGIREVFYLHLYRNTDGIDFLTKCNVIVTQMQGE